MIVQIGRLVQIGRHNLRYVPENVVGRVVRTFTRPALNERKRECGVHHMVEVKVEGKVYTVFDWMLSSLTKQV